MLHGTPRGVCSLRNGSSEVFPGNTCHAHDDVTGCFLCCLRSVTLEQAAALEGQRLVDQEAHGHPYSGLLAGILHERAWSLGMSACV